MVPGQSGAAGKSAGGRGAAGKGAAGRGAAGKAARGGGRGAVAAGVGGTSGGKDRGRKKVEDVSLVTEDQWIDEGETTDGVVR